MSRWMIWRPPERRGSVTEITELNPSEVLTKKEVAERLKVSVRKVEDLHLPTLRLGRRCNRYIWSAVLKHLEDL